jgi:CRISPR-associated protein Cmr5
MNTIAQTRSKFALEELKKLKPVKPADQEKFKKLSAGLPAMILQNGLGHSLAFLLAKGKGEHTIAFEMIAAWLKNQGIVKDDSYGKVVAELSTIPQADYLRGQEEALRVLEWVKRYANAGIFE